MKSKKPTPTTQSEAEATYDYESVYANCAHLELSGFDLKLIFGQLDQSNGQPQVDWHTAVTLPWAQAKILAYFLQANVETFEAVNGKIKLPIGTLPPAPTAHAKSARTPRVDQGQGLAAKLYQQLERDVAKP